MPDESDEEFVTALRGVATSCDFGTTLDEALRDQLVDKVVLPKVRERLVIEGSALSSDRAVLLAHQVKQGRKESQLMDTKSATSTPVQVVHDIKSKLTGKTCHAGSRVSNQGPPNKGTCYRCGSTQHWANSSKCKARKSECRNCPKRGHFESLCRQERSAPNSTREVKLDHAGAEQNAAQLLYVRTPVKHAAVYVTVDVERIDVTFLVETGSSVSIMSWDVYKATFSTNKSLRVPELKLLDYSRKEIPVYGCITATVSYQERCAPVLLYITSQGTTLLGLDGLSALSL